jgi:hypothetical protein
LWIKTRARFLFCFTSLPKPAVSSSEWDDAIARSVKSDEALPADAPGAKLLASKIADASTEKPTEVGPTSKLAAIISGKVYSFASNQLNLKSRHFF